MGGDTEIINDLLFFIGMSQATDIASPRSVPSHTERCLSRCLMIWFVRTQTTERSMSQATDIASLL